MSVGSFFLSNYHTEAGLRQPHDDGFTPRITPTHAAWNDSDWQAPSRKPPLNWSL